MARPVHRPATTPAAPPLTVVLAREIVPPGGTPAIEWWLLTTLPGTTAEAAARMVTWYRHRSRIERFPISRRKPEDVRSKTASKKL